MVKKFLILVVLISLIFQSTPVLADGAFYVSDKDLWHLSTEDQQLCAINYHEGIQRMILTINVKEELKEKKGVWIFPVPAKPDAIKIDIVKGFPKLLGENIKDAAFFSLYRIFESVRFTQLYPMVYSFYKLNSGGATANVSGNGDVTIHQEVEKNGITTELVSATDTVSLQNYLTQKGLTIPSLTQSMLKEYGGQDYSFVISWVSNEKEVPRLPQGETEESWGGNTAVGIYIVFPTNKMYFPLKLTSAYGERKVPALLYVMNYVTPKLYPEIEKYTTVDYFREFSSKSPFEDQGDLEDFFVGVERQSMFLGNRESPVYIFKDLKYTKIKIDPPSKNLTQDLWIENTVPVKVKFIDSLGEYKNNSALEFFFIFICSCLASLVSGIFIFRDKKISRRKFFLLGLSNFFTIITFSLFTYFLKTKDIDSHIQEDLEKDLPTFFKRQYKNYIFAFSICLVLTVSWVIFGKFGKVSEDWWLFIFPLAFASFLWLSVFLNKQNFIHISSGDSSEQKKRYMIVDRVKILFLVFFSSITYVITYLVYPSYSPEYKNLVEFFGFGKMVGTYFDIYDGHLEFFFLLAVCTLSLWIMSMYSLFGLSKKIGIRVLMKDSRKLWFGVCFSVIFCVLTFGAEFLLKKML